MVMFKVCYGYSFWCIRTSPWGEHVQLLCSCLRLVVRLVFRGGGIVLIRIARRGNIPKLPPDQIFLSVTNSSFAWYVRARTVRKGRIVTGSIRETRRVKHTSSRAVYVVCAGSERRIKW